MIGDDDKISIGGDVAAPEDFRFQPPVEKCALRSTHRETAEPLQRPRQARSVRIGELRIRRHARTSVATGLSGEQLQVRDGAQVRNFLRRDIPTRALADQLADFRQCERVEAEVFDQPRLGRDVNRLGGDCGERLGEPRLDFGIGGLGFDGIRANVEHSPQGRRYVRAFDLAGARARQFGVGEAENPDSFVRAELAPDPVEVGAEPIFHRAATFSACVRWDDQRGDLLALSDLQADDSHLLDVLGTSVIFFQLLDVDVVAAGIDDHFLGAADDVQAAIIVETPEVSGVKPSVGQNFGGRSLVAIVTRHHIRTVHDYLADRTRRGHQLDLDAVQRSAYRTDLLRFVGSRDGENGRPLSQAVAFEERDADVVEKFGDAMWQGGAAAYG